MSRCACPRRDGLDCVMARYPSEARAWVAYLEEGGERPEPCDCPCHDKPDDEDGAAACGMEPQ